MSDPSVEAVIAHWDAHAVCYLPGVSDSELLDFEKRYNVKLPGDMRCFYKTTNGTHVKWSSEQDHESYDFYPLSEVKPDSDHSWAMNFADYRELSWWFAIDLTGMGSHGPGIVYFMGAIGGRPLIVARSFSEFLGLYVRDDPRLRPAGAKSYHKSLVGDVG